MSPIIGNCLLVLALVASPAEWLHAIPQLTDCRVIDGDTLEADVHFPCSVALERQTIRLSFDAWEARKIRRSEGIRVTDAEVVRVTDAEVVRGRLAKAYVTARLETALEAGDAVLFVPDVKTDRDVYGRLLGAIYIEHDGVLEDLAETMQRLGHIRTGNLEEL